MGLFDRIFKLREERKPSNTYPEFDVLMDQSLEELRLKTEAHDRAWGISEAAWVVDQDAGTLTFTSPQGIVATCAAQIIATRNSEEGLLMWAWDHPTVPELMQQHAKIVRDYGESQGFIWMTKQRIRCAEDTASQMLALACKLNEAQGAFSGQTGSVTAFMTFNDISLRTVE